MRRTYSAVLTAVISVSCLFLVASDLKAQNYVFNQAAFTVGSAPQSIAVGDFNDDGKPDMAVLDGSVSILLGKADGTFLPHVDYALGSAGTVVPDSVVAGDFNVDGRLDLAVA